MSSILLNWAGLVRPHMQDLAMAIIATLLVVFGNDINNAIKQLVKRHHFVVRTVIFIFVCAFGYGLVTVWLTPVLAQILLKVPSVYLVPALLSIFVALGSYAQKQRHI